MAVLSLPLSFNNSFWSQDYRRGLEVLFGKLEQGVAENDEIVAFIMARVLVEDQLASALMNPELTGSSMTGFGADEGASLFMAFRGLQSESVTQGQAHKSIARELQTLVAEPFDEWAQGHKKRLRERKKAFLEMYLPSYEQAMGEVSKLKHQYLSKTRRADEAEDDAKFAPTRKLSDKYTASPLVRPHDRTPPQRTASVSERIAQRLKEIQNKGASPNAGQKPENGDVAEDGVEAAQKVDKGKGKAVESESPPLRTASPPPMSPPLPPAKLSVATSTSPIPPMPAPPIVIAGLSLPPSAVSQLLTRAASELPLRPIRFPLLGEYRDCFTGEEFVTWLKENVHGFGGSLDRSEDAARDLTEREGLLRRIGEFGNQFELSDDAFYQFRSKAFALDERSESNINSPVKSLAPETLLKRTNTLVNFVSKALNTQGEPTYIKTRQDAEAADQVYRIAVRNLDRQRLSLEDRIEETLKTLQRWENDRLRAVKTVLLQYQGTLSNLPKSLEPSIERSGTLIASFQPESDLTALVERYRTGPFRPEAQIYESVAHDESDVVFGIDMRKWADGGWAGIATGEPRKDVVPPVFIALLTGLDAAYERLPNDIEKRKAWIYEVPLPAVHHLREALNSVPPGHPIPAELFEKYDAPVIASALKLWLLELNPPLAMWEGWEEIRKLYPTVGSAKADVELSVEEHMQDLKGALLRLPMVHLIVLDKVLNHFKALIASTIVEESQEVFTTKLALSVGRTIIRPRFESELSIQDRHPTLLFIDLLKNYDSILPSTIAQKKRESERKVPLRKRTAPVDMRLSRSRISIDADPKQLLVAQQLAQNPTLARKALSPERPTQVHASVTETERTGHARIQEPAAVPTSTPAAPVAPSDATPRPTFKEPPPEDDDLPPRPTFKEPLPEVDDDDAPPRPSFKDPPPEEDDSPPRPSFVDPPPEVDESSPPKAVVAEEADNDLAAPISVTPPTPQEHLKRTSVSLSRSGSRSPPKGSRSSSPNPESLGTQTSPLARTPVGQLRGPRMAARGPRSPAGSNVNSLVATMNRKSISGSPPSKSPPPTAHKRLSSPPRPASVFGRSGVFGK